MRVTLGRMIDHVHLRVSDVEASKRFYRAVFASLGLPDVIHEGQGFFHADELFVDKAEDTSLASIWRSRRPIATPCTPSTRPPLLPVAVTTAHRGSAPTIPGTTVLSFWIPMATTSRPCSTARPLGPRRRSWSRQRLHRRDDCGRRLRARNPDQASAEVIRAAGRSPSWRQTSFDVRRAGTRSPGRHPWWHRRSARSPRSAPAIAGSASTTLTSRLTRCTTACRRARRRNDREPADHLEAGQRCLGQRRHALEPDHALRRRHREQRAACRQRTSAAGGGQIGDASHRPVRRACSASPRATDA